MKHIRFIKYLSVALITSLFVLMILGLLLNDSTRVKAQLESETYEGAFSESVWIDLADTISEARRALDGGTLDLEIPRPTFTVTLGAWRNLRPTESYLHSVSLLSSSYEVDCVTPGQASRGWVVGDYGVILTYCNGVWDHAITVESIPTNLYSVQAISSTLGVAVGDDGAVLMYLWDRIALDWVWTKSPIPVGDETLYSISMVPDGTGQYKGWAVGHEAGNGKGTLVYGTITPTTINGHPSHSYTWQNVTASYPDLPEVTAYYAVDMLTPNDGWAVGGVWPNNGVIIHWDGSQWSVSLETISNTLYGIHMRSATDGWAVGQGGLIYHYDGASWSLVASPTSEILTDVGFLPNGEGWIVGYNGTFLKYNGSTWTEFTDMRTDRFDFRSVDFSSGHGWVVGAHFSMQIGGQILEYDENLWLAVTPPTDNQLNDVSVVSDSDAWAVGAADGDGGTIIHWDGKHWQRIFQPELPIPPSNFQAVDMVSSRDGWAAGDPLSAEEPAILLHWDGNRWEQPRYDAPVNVRVNDIAMLDESFGWAVADTGNAVAKYDGLSGFWSANHTCGGFYADLEGVTLFPESTVFGWDAWSVGRVLGLAPETPQVFFYSYIGGCSGGYAWDAVDAPVACAFPTAVPPPAPTPTPTPVPPPTDGAMKTDFGDIEMSRSKTITEEVYGYAVGDYVDRASFYVYDLYGNWETFYCQEENSSYAPTRFNTVDIVDDSGVAWMAGSYNDPNLDLPWAYISYFDATLTRHWAEPPYPRNGRNFYHRPIKSIAMSSDTMGWAVGDPYTQFSVIYQYPFPNFTMNVEPDFRAVTPGGSADYTVTINPLGDFIAETSLFIFNLPFGVTSTISPTSISSGEEATIQIDTSTNTPLGIYELYLWGHSVFNSGDYVVDVYRYTPFELTVTNNPIYSVSPTHGPAETIVTIAGNNFGADPGPGQRSTPTNHVILAGKQMPDANVQSWSNTQITIRVPDSVILFPNGPVIGIVSVTASGYLSNEDYQFRLDNRLNEVSIERQNGEIIITLTGTSFGNDPGPILRNTDHEHVTLGGTRIPNSSVTSWSNNSIVFRVPEGTNSGSVSVTSNGFESNAIYVLLKTPYVYLPLVRK